MKLQDIALFRGFPETECALLDSIVQRSELQPGHILFEEGDPGDALFIIDSGSIRIFKRLDPELGTEKSLALFQDADLFGEMTILDGAPRSASARVETPSVILKIPRDDFINLMRNCPSAAFRIFVGITRQMAQRLRQTSEELVVLYEVGRLIGEAKSLDALLHGVLTSVIGGTLARLGAIFFLNDITNRLEIREAEGEDSVDLLSLKTPVGQGVVGRSIVLNQSIRIDDFGTSEFAALPKFGYERPRMLITPLIHGEKPFGAVYLANPADGPAFTNANANLLAAVASQAAAAIESALHNQAAQAKEQLERHYYQF